jgi:hypothetical protein
MSREREREAKEGELERCFWSKVDVKGDDECWPWRGHLTPRGHGRWYVSSFASSGASEAGRVYAHRQAYMFYYGRIPDGLFCCHTCLEKSCCNPHHLFLATPAESVRNNIRRGLVKSGSALVCAKLTETAVSEIRRRYASAQAGGTSHTKLAKEYGVTAGAIQLVLNRRNWKDVA